MKKLLLLFLACSIVYSFSTTAYSAEGPYVGINLGAAMLTDSDLTEPGFSASLESDMGFTGGIALGYGFNNNMRVEGEFVYQKNDVDKIEALGVNLDAGGDTTSLALLLNGYYDFANSSAFTPFISLGIGMAKVEANDISIAGFQVGSDDDTVFAYQVGLGVGYAVSEKTSIDLKYRYFGTDDPDFDGTEAEYASHNFYIGLRFGF